MDTAWQPGTGLHLQCTLSKPADKDTNKTNDTATPEWEVIYCLAEEALSEIYCINIELTSRTMDIDRDALIGQRANLCLYQDGRLQRTWHGVIAEFESGDTGVAHRAYGMILVPTLWCLSLYHNSRIFQDQSVVDIITALMQEEQITHYHFALHNTPPKREYCVQYQEDNLAFLQRLLAEEGIAYYFEQTNDQHHLVFINHNDTPWLSETPIPYLSDADALSDAPCMQAFSLAFKSGPTEVVLGDYDENNPSKPLLSRATVSEEERCNDHPARHYQHMGRMMNPERGQELAQIRLEALRNRCQTASGFSNHPALLPGYRIRIGEYPEAALPQGWLLTRVTHEIHQPQAAEAYAGNKSTTYSNTLSGIPGRKAYRPRPLPKPQVHGPHLARVIGPKEEEIYCDDKLRVKVAFLWDQSNKEHTATSCWIRAAQNWASTRHGFVSIPRVGMEVLVNHMDGDIDRPIITDSLYNGQQLPPYELPRHKTKTVFRSQTYQGKGHNELSFDDRTDHEQVYFHAQKDYKAHIGHDETLTIGDDHHIHIGHDQYLHTKKSTHLTVGGNQYEHIKGDSTLEVGGDLQCYVGEDCYWESKAGMYFTAQDNIIITAEESVELRCHNSSLTMRNGDVTFSSPSFAMGRNPSAPPSVAYSGQKPTLPKGFTLPDAPPEVTNTITEAVNPASEQAAEEAASHHFVMAATDEAQNTPTENNNLKALLQENNHNIMLLTLTEATEVTKSFGWEQLKSGWVDMTESAPGQLAVNYGTHGKDMVTTAMIINKLGGLGIKASTYINHKGTELIKLTGYPGIRKILKAPVFAAKNPKVVDIGLGRYGRMKNLTGGIRLTFYVAAAYRTLDYILNDHTSLMGLVGGLTTDMAKGVVIALAAGVGGELAVALSAGAAFVVIPLAGMIAAAIATTIGLSILDEKFGITDKIIRMLEAHADKATQKMEPVDSHLYPGLISIDDTFRGRLQI